MTYPASQVSLDAWTALTEKYSNWGRWGPDDQLGTLNYISADAVAQAGHEIRTGRVFSLSIPFDANGPQTGRKGRFNPIHLMLRDGGDALSGAALQATGGVDRQIRGTDDIIIMPLQCATQWDALAHVLHNGLMYNGYSAALVSSFGAERNGIERASAKIAGRGILLDVPRSQGRISLDPGEGITSADLENAAAHHGIDVRQGDIVLVRTGLMHEVRRRGSWDDYCGGPAPGLALDSLGWIWEHHIAAVATDTWGVEVQPPPTPDVHQPFHIVAITYMGLLLGEIFDLEKLAQACSEDGRYSFFFSALPLPITGAVGSPINPMVCK